MRGIPIIAMAMCLLGATFLGGVATEAQAHYCRSKDPEQACGDCKDRSNGTDPYHKHLYDNEEEDLYCESGPCCDDAQADLRALFRMPAPMQLP